MKEPITIDFLEKDETVNSNSYCKFLWQNSPYFFLINLVCICPGIKFECMSSFFFSSGTEYLKANGKRMSYFFFLHCIFCEGQYLHWTVHVLFIQSFIHTCFEMNALPILTICDYIRANISKMMMKETFLYYY